MGWRWSAINNLLLCNINRFAEKRWSISANINSKSNFMYLMLHGKARPRLFVRHFESILIRLVPSKPFGWQIKPARIIFSKPNKIKIVIIPSQSIETTFEISKHSFDILKQKTFFQNIAEIFKTFEIDTSKRANGEQNIEKMISSTASGFMFSL